MEGLSGLVGESLALPDAPPVAEQEREARGPDHAKAVTAAAEDDDSLPGCLARAAMTVSILAFLNEVDLPGELSPILAPVVLVAAPALYSWNRKKEDRRRARQSRASAPASTPAQIAAPPPEDPSAVP